jgi:hypothetical protein
MFLCSCYFAFNDAPHFYARERPVSRDENWLGFEFFVEIRADGWRKLSTRRGDAGRTVVEEEFMAGGDEAAVNFENKAMVGGRGENEALARLARRDRHAGKQDAPRNRGLGLVGSENFERQDGFHEVGGV